jgi:hypothetical protein
MSAVGAWSLFSAFHLQTFGMHNHLNMTLAIVYLWLTLQVWKHNTICFSINPLTLDLQAKSKVQKEFTSVRGRLKAMLERRGLFWSVAARNMHSALNRLRSDRSFSRQRQKFVVLKETTITNQTTSASSIQKSITYSITTHRQQLV